jgi:hypothetical protein
MTTIGTIFMAGELDEREESGLAGMVNAFWLKKGSNSSGFHSLQLPGQPHSQAISPLLAAARG